jgi:hypothetical protein
MNRNPNGGWRFLVRWGALSAILLSLGIAMTHAQEQGAVYPLFQAPKLGAKGDVRLRCHKDAPQPITVRGYLTRANVGHLATSGVAGMRGSENASRKWIRFELSGLTPVLRPALLEAVYQVVEGGETSEHRESVEIAIEESVLAVDLAGIVDVTGSRVETEIGFDVIVSTKFRNNNAGIISGIVTVKNAAGHVLFHGAWPEPPSAPAGTFPLPSPVRTFTNASGVKIDASVVDYLKQSVTLQVNGRKAVVDLTTLSAEDQTYLKDLAVELGLIAAP